jgi:signal transduction histidine kinase
MKSVRRGVMAGAVLWTVGLAGIVTMLVPLSRSAFSTIIRIHDYHMIVALVAVACLIAGVAVARRAFVPFDELRRRLSSVQKGLDTRLDGRYPSEVQPLVNDLNALLAHNEDAVSRAAAKAGDLAHGLKTPLAVLSNEADRLAGDGESELSATIRQQIALMKRHIDYHLAHARATASGAGIGLRCTVVDSAGGLVRTLERLHAARGLKIVVHVSPSHSVRTRREDLDEMLGNLLDNACKWARSQVAITSSVTDTDVVVEVEDDGPGIPADMRERVMQRGVRADEAAPGFGLGLAIVRDLAELHGGSIALETSASGGTRARLQLPAAG